MTRPHESTHEREPDRRGVVIPPRFWGEIAGYCATTGCGARAVRVTVKPDVPGPIRVAPPRCPLCGQQLQHVSLRSQETLEAEEDRHALETVAVLAYQAGHPGELAVSVGVFLGGGSLTVSLDGAPPVVLAADRPARPEARCDG